MPTLRALPGFDWSKVQWGGPDEPQTETCSYCNADLGEPEEPDYEVPLMLWRKDGSCAQFCRICQEQWWGVR